jgi:hypothetical protein
VPAARLAALGCSGRRQPPLVVFRPFDREHEALRPHRVVEQTVELTVTVLGPAPSPEARATIDDVAASTWSSRRNLVAAAIGAPASSG